MCQTVFVKHDYGVATIDTLGSACAFFGFKRVESAYDKEGYGDFRKMLKEGSCACPLDFSKLMPEHDHFTKWVFDYEDFKPPTKNEADDV